MAGQPVCEITLFVTITSIESLVVQVPLLASTIKYPEYLSDEVVANTANESVEVSPFGPVHNQDVASPPTSNRLMLLPAQTCVSPSIEAAGPSSSVTIISSEIVQFPSLYSTVTVYVPATPTGTVGFCSVEVNPFGPVQENVPSVILVVLAARASGEPTQAEV